MSMLGTFYYPWYGNAGDQWRHWKEGGHNPLLSWASNFAPDLFLGHIDLGTRLYDSLDPQMVTQQLQLMKRAGIGFVVCSWWGVGDYTDIALKSLLDASKYYYPDLKWCIYYEKEGYTNLPETQIQSDLAYIESSYGKNERFLRINGKPVVFVYSNSDSLDYVEKWGRVRNHFDGIYTVLKVVKGFRSYENLADSWHQYAPANRYASFPPYSAFVSPGYWKYHEPPKLERNLEQFKDAVRQLKNSNVQFQLVETWNEYHEGTMIEPAIQIVHDDKILPFKEMVSYGTQFIDALRG